MSDPQPNAEMIEYWNEAAGVKWVAQQARLDRQLGPLGDEALARASARPGERVLDVGCGCGATTLALARAVGENGHVTGLDLSGPMLEHARRQAEAAGLMSRIDWRHGDAQVVPLGRAEYDLVFSRFGVMFFDDPKAAFRNLAASTRPGGRLVFVCWQGREANPWLTAPAQAAARYLEMPKPPDPDAPGPFAFGEAERVRRILLAAGYRDVAIEAQNDLLLLGNGSLEDAIEVALEVGPVAGALREANPEPEVRAKVRAAVTEALQQFEGLRAPYGAWFVTAKAP